MNMKIALLAATVLLSAAPAFAQTPTSCTAPPAAAADLTVAREGPDVLVTWRDATTDVPCKASRFYVELSRGGEEVREFSPAPDDDEVTQRLRMPTVAYGGKHRIAVRSFNRAGISSVVSVYLNESNLGCFMPPDPVSSIVAGINGRTVNVKWLHPGSCTLTGFRIAAAASPDGPDLYAVDVQNPALREFSATAPPGVWYIRVYAESYRRYTPPSGWAVVNVQ